MTSDGTGPSSPAQPAPVQPAPAQPAPPRPGVLTRLADLDRRIVPVVALRLDRMLPRRHGALTGFALDVRERRILGALALVLLACAVGLAVIGG